MSRNRIIQLVAVLLAVAFVAGASLVTRAVEDQRQELQLTSSIDVKEKLPPQVAIATAALGSFRGLIVDVLWYRLEMLKRDGKFHEANTLSQWITTLQPRFPQVWSFMAWNMAYNISVATYTPDERLDWVTKGIDLLRDKGIPYNPNAIRLYRELGWIFFHKVGQYSDDQHWYYKRRFAQEWQEVLGAEAEGGSTQQIIAAFRPVAEAYDAYVNQSHPTREALSLLDQLAASDPRLTEPLTELRDEPLVAFDRKLTRLRDRLAEDEPLAAAKLDPLLELVQAQRERDKYSPEQLLAQADPEAAAIVSQLGELLGLTPGEALLRRIGRLGLVLQSSDARMLGMLDNPNLDPQDKALLTLLSDEVNRDAVARAVAFLRALVVSERYHMDPNFMLQLMAEFGPVDWRNSAAHSLYWSSLGVRQAKHLRNKKDIDLLNTIRQTIHSLQTLRDVGRTSYDAVSGYITQLPDPRFIPAYEKAVLEGGEEVQRAEWGGTTADSFDAGYENFLIRSVVITYLYGDEQQARDYYTKLRTKFGDKDHNLRSGRYLLPLDQFVTRELVEDISMMSVAVPTIDSLLGRGLALGLANNRRDIYERFKTISRNIHETFQKKAIDNPTAVQDRMKIPPFKRLEEEAYLNYMRAEGVSLLLRMRVWSNTPNDLKQAVYERLRPSLVQQAQAESVDVDRAFPPPAGSLLRPPGEGTTTTDEQADQAAQPTEGVRVAPQ